MSGRQMRFCDDCQYTLLFANFAAHQLGQQHRRMAHAREIGAQHERERLRAKAYGQALYGPGRAFADWLLADPEPER